MTKITFPITELEGNRFQVCADLAIYAQEAITATCYKYAGTCYVHQEKDDDTIVVTFESKDGNAISAETVKQFCSDLIDQQLRVDVNKQCGHIRDLIVEEAFKPITK